jgi:[ribosomal protein S18]-alanine N-acetyltransferase
MHSEDKDSLVLREAHAADYVTISAWIPDALSCLRWAGPLVPFPFSSHDLEGLLQFEGCRTYCLSSREGVVYGFGQHFALKDDAVHLGRIIVAPLERGKGIGYQLCSQLVTRAVENTKAHHVTLRVYKNNLPAVALYESLGFLPVESRSDDELWFMQKST